MGIKITKMQGCGNDFVILDFEEYKNGLENKLWDSMPEAAQKLCNRNFGVGSDGLIIPNSQTEETDIGWFFFNADGTTAQMCGNGIRCFAKYAYDNKLVDKKEFTVKTLAGIITPKLTEDGNVRVNMSKPILEPEKIPFIPNNNLRYKIAVKDRIFEGNAISMGNPHFIIFLNNNENTLALAKEYGAYIENAAEFPEKTNVEFVKVHNRKKIELSVWERGCGITLACGTGACAATVAGVLNGLTDNSVDVNLSGGIVHIDWQGTNENVNESVFMTGPAKYVFSAELKL